MSSKRNQDQKRCEDAGNGATPADDQVTVKSLAEAMLAMCRSGIQAPQLHIPVPEKFALGGNYERWEDQLRRYLKNFSKDRHEDLGHKEGRRADGGDRRTELGEEHGQKIGSRIPEVRYIFLLYAM
jgi:hypothetical protein